MSDGMAHSMKAKRGVDQGRPLSRCLFTIAIAPCLSKIDERLKSLDPSSRLVINTFLDDLTIVVPTTVVEQAVNIVGEEFRALGLSMNESKTQAWTVNPGTPLPRA